MSAPPHCACDTARCCTASLRGCLQLVADVRKCFDASVHELNHVGQRGVQVGGDWGAIVQEDALTPRHGRQFQLGHLHMCKKEQEQLVLSWMSSSW
eukprot:1151097-Pelagomonas_calceolata.AAC.3